MQMPLPVEPMVIFPSGVSSFRVVTIMLFEFIYFSRPDSVLDGRSVYECRKRFGYELAKESPVEADVVIPVPDSGVPSAVGFAQQSGTPFELGIIRNHYVGRTFIEPTQQIRALDVKTGLPLWTKQLADSCNGLIVSGGMAFLNGHDGVLYALEVDNRG